MDRRVIRVVSAVIAFDGRYLITQRKPTAVLPLLWEFPGGRIEADESPSDALLREVAYRIGVRVDVTGPMAEHTHAYSTYDVLMTTFACTLRDGEVPRAINVHDLRWVTSTQFADYAFPPADEQSVSKLLGLLNN